MDKSNILSPQVSGGSDLQMQSPSGLGVDMFRSGGDNSDNYMLGTPSGEVMFRMENGQEMQTNGKRDLGMEVDSLKTTVDQLNTNLEKLIALQTKDVSSHTNIDADSRQAVHDTNYISRGNDTADDHRTMTESPDRQYQTGRGYSNHVQFNRFNTGYTKPDTYDGKSSWTDYLTQFNMVCRLNGWTDEVKALKLATSMRGTAKCILTDLKPEQLDNYQNLVNALSMRFEPKNQCEMYRAQMNARVRNRGESLPELVQDIKRLVRLAYPTAPAEVRDSLAYKCFRDALNDQDMEWAICQNTSENIDDALNLALKFEAFKVSRNKQRYQVRMQTETVPVRPEANVPQDRARADNYKPRYRDETDKNKRCFYCDRLGHVRRNCWKLKRDNYMPTSRNSYETNNGIPQNLDQVNIPLN